MRFSGKFSRFHTLVMVLMTLIGSSAFATSHTPFRPQNPCLAATSSPDFSSTKQLANTRGLQFLENFWTPKSGILDVNVTADTVQVFTTPEQYETVRWGLPKRFQGAEVMVIADHQVRYSRKKMPQELQQDLAKVVGWNKKSVTEYGGANYLKPPVILVTGTSAGIGLELAKLLQQTNYRIVLTARKNSLSALEKAGINESDRLLLRPLDVTNAEERAALASEIQEKWGGVDFLINNAGIAYRSVTEHMDENALNYQMAVNFTGPIELARLFIPTMRMKGRGKIINVSSMSGIMGMPTMGSYSASKFALEGNMESLYYELRPWGVQVVLVQPGFVNSDSHTRVVYSGPAEAAERDQGNVYHQYYKSMAPFVSKLMKLSLRNATDIAKVVMKTTESKRTALRVTATPDAYFFKMLRRILPETLYENLMYYALPGVRSWGDPEAASELLETDEE